MRNLGLITYSAEKVSDKAMSGYHKDAKGVTEQIRAIYDTIAELGIHYHLG